jgi:hypothetical protein
MYGLNFVRNGRQGRRGGIHVHEGVSCATSELVGGHYFDEGEEDPWAFTEWSTETNEFKLAAYAK